MVTPRCLLTGYNLQPCDFQGPALTLSQSPHYYGILDAAAVLHRILFWLFLAELAQHFVGLYDFNSS